MGTWNLFCPLAQLAAWIANPLDRSSRKKKSSQWTFPSNKGQMASTYLINDCSCPLRALVDSFDAPLFSRYSIGLAWKGYVRYFYIDPSSHCGGLFNGSFPTKKF